MKLWFTKISPIRQPHLLNIDIWSFIIIEDQSIIYCILFTEIINNKDTLPYFVACPLAHVVTRWLCCPAAFFCTMPGGSSGLRLTLFSPFINRALWAYIVPFVHEACPCSKTIQRVCWSASFWQSHSFSLRLSAGSLILLIQFTAENLNWHKEAKQEGLKIIFSSAFWY